MDDICTVHQVLRDGLPIAQGSQVRLPSGEHIPRVNSIKITALPGPGMWELTITLPVKFGDPIT